MDDWLGVWGNEIHADYLAHDRLAEARARAARHSILSELRAQRRSMTPGWLARRLAGATEALAPWWATVGRLTTRPSRRWSHR